MLLLRIPSAYRNHAFPDSYNRMQTLSRLPLLLFLDLLESGDPLLPRNHIVSDFVNANHRIMWSPSVSF